MVRVNWDVFVLFHAEMDGEPCGISDFPYNKSIQKEQIR